MSLTSRPSARHRVLVPLVPLAALVIVITVLAACARPSDPPAVAVGPTTTSALNAPGSVHTQDAAQRLADELLTRAVLPPGSVSVPTTPAPILDQPFQVPSTPNLASAHRFDRVPLTFAATVAYLQHVVPSGFTPTGSGQTGFGIPTTGLPVALPAGPGPKRPYTVTESDVTYTLSAPPDGVESADLLVSVANRGAAATVSFVRVDTQVTWTPAKPAAELVPAQDHVAVVSLTEMFPDNEVNGAPPPRRVVVRDPSGFTALADAADALIPALPGVHSCPADLGTRYIVAFGRAVGGAPNLVFTAGACDDVMVTAKGQTLAVLSDSSAFRNAYLSALGLPAAG